MGKFTEEALLEFLPENNLVKWNYQYHIKVLLNSFYFNGHALGFHPQTFI